MVKSGIQYYYYYFYSTGRCELEHIKFLGFLLILYNEPLLDLITVMVSLSDSD